MGRALPELSRQGARGCDSAPERQALQSSTRRESLERDIELPLSSFFASELSGVREDAVDRLRICCIFSRMRSAL